MPTHLAYLLLTPHALNARHFAAPLAQLFSADTLALAGAQVISLDDELIGEYLTLLSERSDAKAKEFRSYLERIVQEADRRALLFFFAGRNTSSDIASLLPPSVGPAIAFSASDRTEAEESLSLFYTHLKKSNPVVSSLPPESERSLVLLKPDNWRSPSPQPAFILQMLAASETTLIAAKVVQMSIAEALDFYGQVKEPLITRLAPRFASQARLVLEQALSLSLPAQIEAQLAASVGAFAAEAEFHKIIAYISGSSPEEVPEEKWNDAGSATTLALLYEGIDAVTQMRTIIGATDPAKAGPSTIRNSFGIDILENTVHGSDTPQSAAREAKVVRIEESTIATLLKTL